MPEVVLASKRSKLQTCVSVVDFCIACCVQIYARLHVKQRDEGIKGHVAEIGVYLGKSFAPLALLRGPQARVGRSYIDRSCSLDFEGHIPLSSYPSNICKQHANVAQCKFSCRHSRGENWRTTWHLCSYSPANRTVLLFTYDIRFVTHSDSHVTECSAVKLQECAVGIDTFAPFIDGEGSKGRRNYALAKQNLCKCLQGEPLVSTIGAVPQSSCFTLI
jgi:hypothetical protein